MRGKQQISMPRKFGLRLGMLGIQLYRNDGKIGEAVSHMFMYRWYYTRHGE